MTATFWLIVSAMTLCVLGLLLRPLLRRPSTVTSEQEKTLPVYRQQFSELEQDRADGLLTDEQYRTARSELERRVLEEAGSVETPTAAT
ncbi:MAG TPA: c-type cytochrome biogenesis protein CcmI, partial [Nitrospira sp.]|nr:c-type cytochrome biogenesis protein CcmI [Nitrospira sp.]